MADVIIPVGGSKPTTIIPNESIEAKLAREAVEEQERLLAEEAAKKAKEEADQNKPDPDKPAPDGPIEETRLELTQEDGTVLNLLLDKDGNALDDKGTILYTSEQIKEMTEGSGEEIDQFTAISALSGIKLLNEDGTEKQYENTIEGFAKRELDIKQLALVEGQRLGIESFFEANPELESMYNYKRIYGTLDNYSAFVDYNKVVVNPNDKEANLDIIFKAEIAKGASPERAKKIANFSLVEDTLVQDTEDALTFLKTRQNHEVEEATKLKNASILAEIEKENTYFGVAYDNKGKEIVLNVENSIYDIVVNKGVVGNVVIPKEGLVVKSPDGQTKHFTRKQIFDYISLPVKEINGELVTQAQLDEYKRLTDKSQLITSYIRNLLGGDLSQLVEAAKLKDKANTVRKLVVKTGSGTSRSNSTTKGKPIIIVK